MEMSQTIRMSYRRCRVGLDKEKLSHMRIEMLNKYNKKSKYNSQWDQLMWLADWLEIVWVVLKDWRLALVNEKICC